MQIDNEKFLIAAFQVAAQGLRDLGYAITLFNPRELGAFGNQEAEQLMTSQVNEHLSSLMEPRLLDKLLIDPDRSPMDLVQSVADHSIWGLEKNDPNLYDECEPPPGGFADSHECLMELIETARYTGDNYENSSVLAFKQQLARFSIWDWTHDDGDPIKECEVPADGYQGSHQCLMDLIIEARHLIFTLNEASSREVNNEAKPGAKPGFISPITLDVNDGRGMGSHHTVKLQWWWRDLESGSNPPAHVLPILNEHLMIDVAGLLANGIDSGNVCKNVRACMSDDEDGSTYQAWWEATK